MPADAIEAEASRLCICLQDGLFTYAVISAARQVTAYKEIRNHRNLAPDIFCRLVLESETLLQSAFRKTLVLSSANLFTMIPSAFSGADQRLAQLLLDDVVFLDEVRSCEVKDEEMRVLFSFPGSVRTLLEDYLGEISIGHASAQDVQIAKLLSGESDPVFLLHLFSQHLTLTVFREGRLHLCNSFEFETEADILHILNSFRQLNGMEAGAGNLYAVGNFDMNSPVFRGLKAYLPEIQTPGLLKDFIWFNREGLPFWRFAFFAMA
jgi:hypothetical protein